MTAEHTPMTKERLMRYRSLRMENENQLERLARMKSGEQFPAMREGEGAQHTGAAGDRLTDAVIRRMEYEERIRPLIEANLREMEKIEEAISQIQDPMEREVLRLRYLDGACWRPIPWGEVALRIYGDNDDKHLRATYRLYSRALSSMGVYDKEGDSDE